MGEWECGTRSIRSGHGDLSRIQNSFDGGKDKTADFTDEIKTTTVLQGNLNGSSLAHALLPQLAEEMNADVIMISEPYRDRDTLTWLANTSRTVVLWLRGRARSQITNQGKGADYVWAKVGDVTYVNVYLTPNCSTAEFEQKVEALEDVLRNITGNVILAGDVNARAIEWGMTKTNKRGCC